MNKRMLALLLVAATSTLTACGGNSSDGNNASNNSGSETDNSDTGDGTGTDTGDDTGTDDSGSDTGTDTGTETLTCDTSRFAEDANVRVPTSDELETWANTWSGEQGSYNDAGDFTSTGSFSFVSTAAGTIVLNTSVYNPESICIEPDADPVMMYLHFDEAHLDLFADGQFSGESPADASISIRNLTAEDDSTASDEYPASGTLGTLSISGNPSGISSVPATFAPATSSKEGLYQIWRVSAGSNTWALSLSGYSIGSVANFGTWQGTNVANKLPGLGVSVDLAAGEWEFTNVSLNALPGSSGTMTLNGTLHSTPVTGEAVEISGTGTVQAGSGFDSDTLAVTQPNSVYTRYTWTSTSGMTLYFDQPGQAGFGQVVSFVSWLGNTWYITNPGSNITVNETDHTISFNDLVVPGFSGETTSLTLNGTLSLQ